MTAIIDSHPLSLVHPSLSMEQSLPQAQDKETIDDKIKVILNAIRGEITAIQESSKQVKAISASYQNSCIDTERKKCTPLTLLALSALGFTATAASSGFFLLYRSN